jgi:pyruvate dehydrogenase E2 component (dihydrolipoamide acetyltransferase)
VCSSDLQDLDGASQSRGAVAARSGEDKVIPNSMMRKTIAKRLLAGKNEAPHFYLTVSADMTRMNDWRARLNKDSDKTGVKVSVNDLVIMAVAKALAKHRDINASWQGESIVEFGNVHVAMAVALPTGLVTPVIRYTDQMSIRDIAKSSRELALKAKDGKLTNDDYTGGTFTISNLGMFGIEEFTAIINPPQAAILAVGATIPTPAVDSKGQVVAQPRMKMTMSCDHRVIDGAMGAQFLQTLVSYLEDPLNMLS